MGHAYYIALAPEARVATLGKWENFPGDLPIVPSDTVEKILHHCPFLKSEGRTFWGENLEEFELDQGDMQFLVFEVHEGIDRLPLREIVEICQALGPVTLMNMDLACRIEVKAGDGTRKIIDRLEKAERSMDRISIRPDSPRLLACPKCGRKPATTSDRCMYCGTSLA